MNRKKELKQMYKETKVESGVYEIRNVRNDKRFIASTPNLKTLNGKKFTLKNGTFINKALQEDWNSHGEDSFEFTVLEVLKKKEEGYFNEKSELEKLEEKWLEKLQPYGENGYN
ncbi:GIY-YIG nuclease family protein [Cytobacillus horneckiae]|uniref:GIY-YIG nuclease family protein n=1 Tax=Cytobacillus horneckiae TaxID=549687 RepID=UPI003D21C4A0